MADKNKDYVDVFFDEKYRPLTTDEVEKISLSTSVIAKSLYKPLSYLDTNFAALSSVFTLFGLIIFFHRYDGKIEHIYIAAFAFAVLINMSLMPFKFLFKRVLAYGSLIGYKNALFKEIKDSHVKEFTEEDYKILDETVNLDDDNFAAYRIIKMYDPHHDKYVYVSFESNKRIKIIAPEQAGFIALFFDGGDNENQGVLTPFIPNKGDSSTVKYYRVEQIGENASGILSFVDLKNCNALGDMNYGKKNSALAYIENLGSSYVSNIFYYPTKEMYEKKHSQLISIDFTNGNRVIKHGSYVEPKYDFDTINVDVAKGFFSPEGKPRKGGILAMLIPMIISLILIYVNLKYNLHNKHDVTLFTKISETLLIMGCSWFPLYIILKSFFLKRKEMIVFDSFRIRNQETGTTFNFNLDMIAVAVLYTFALNFFLNDNIKAFITTQSLDVYLIRTSFIVLPFIATSFIYLFISFIYSKLNKTNEKE